MIYSGVPQYIMEEKLLDMMVVEALKGYFETFDNVQFLEGEGPNLGPALSADANTAFWSGLYIQVQPQLTILVG